MKLTKREFMNQYAHIHATPVHKLEAMGLTPVECDCGDPECPGWKMVNDTMPGWTGTLERLGCCERRELPSNINQAPKRRGYVPRGD